MPYTYGAGTGDDTTFVVGVSLGATAVPCLVTGWFYPTTLTATRKLWSANTTGIFGAEVDTTTSQIRLRSDNTTDGQWTCNPAIVIDEWRFLAFLFSGLDTGPAGAWRVWSGTVDTPPVEHSVTVAVAPVGNFVGSTGFYVGNGGTGTLAYQGSIAQVSLIATSSTAALARLGIATAGTITQAEANRILTYIVTPLWEGYPVHMTNFGGNSYASGVSAYALDLEGAVAPRALGGHSTTATINPITVTHNGATLSTLRAPRPLQVSPYNSWQRH